LADLENPLYEIVGEKDFEQYVSSFGFSLYERQAQRLEQVI